MLYDSSYHLSWGGGVAWETELIGLVSSMYGNLDPSNSGRVTFRDPMDDILNNIREITFRAAIRNAQDDPATSKVQTVSYTSEASRIQYGLDVPNLIIGVVISFLGVLATVPLFWGWWTLGRAFSFSPLEMVNAFYGGAGRQDAGIADQLAQANGNAPARDLADFFSKEEAKGGSNIRYGVVADGTDRLAFGIRGRDVIRKPERGEIL
jgi:hypothetical protein